MENSKIIMNDAIIKDINDVIKKLKYGHVLITVHNSRIVQIEVTEKSRFDYVWQTEGGGI
jgi:hypothetical protein